ncbi:MAG: hypothetical protein WCH39_09700 [Schlesneria sp.]
MIRIRDVITVNGTVNDCRLTVDYYPDIGPSAVGPIMTAELKATRDKPHGIILSVEVQNDWRRKGYELKFLQAIYDQWMDLHFDAKGTGIEEFVEAAIEP